MWVLIVQAVEVNSEIFQEDQERIKLPLCLGGNNETVFHGLIFTIALVQDLPLQDKHGVFLFGEFELPALEAGVILPSGETECASVLAVFSGTVCK